MHTGIHSHKLPALIVNGRGNVPDIQVYCQLVLLSYHERAIHFRRKEVKSICARDSAGTTRAPEGARAKLLFWKGNLCVRGRLQICWMRDFHDSLLSCVNAKRQRLKPIQEPSLTAGLKPGPTKRLTFCWNCARHTETNSEKSTEKIPGGASHDGHSNPTERKAATTNGNYFIVLLDCSMCLPPARRSATSYIGALSRRGWAGRNTRTAYDADR
jgi:hypothetical protein